MLLSVVVAPEGLGVFGEEQGLEGDEFMESNERLQRLEHVAEAPDGPGGLSKKRQRTEDETLLRPYRVARYQRLLACHSTLTLSTTLLIVASTSSSCLPSVF